MALVFEHLNSTQSQSISYFFLTQKQPLPVEKTAGLCRRNLVEGKVSHHGNLQPDKDAGGRPLTYRGSSICIVSQKRPFRDKMM